MSQDRFVFVYVPELNCVAEIISYGAHASTIAYTKNGRSHVMTISNEDFIERASIGYEEEDE